MTGKGRALVLALAVAAAVVPWATAGAQAPAEGPYAEIPVACGPNLVLDPTHGEPGTEVTVTATFDGCTDMALSYADASCTGNVTGDDVELEFPISVTTAGDPPVTTAVGTFTAPFVEPYPPVVDAIEDLVVTVRCTQDASPIAPTEGTDPPVVINVYSWDPATFALELFAQTDTDPPPTVEPEVPGVVNGAPAFTG